jgi:hypothetical protein
MSFIQQWHFPFLFTFLLAAISKKELTPRICYSSGSSRRPGPHTRRYPGRFHSLESVNSHGSSQNRKNEAIYSRSCIVQESRLSLSAIHHPLPSLLCPFFPPSPHPPPISLSVAGKPASLRASKSSQNSEPFDVLSASLSPDVDSLPCFCECGLTRGRLFLSSSASPYFVLLLAISFAFAHRPW